MRLDGPVVDLPGLQLDAVLWSQLIPPSLAESLSRF
jgi:hypothetical protein